jgi:hypothetical protein
VPPWWRLQRASGSWRRWSPPQISTWGTALRPRHPAVAVGTPTFTILGSTDSGWTYPPAEHTQTALDLECQPCNRNVCERGLVTDRAHPGIEGNLTDPIDGAQIGVGGTASLEGE